MIWAAAAMLAAASPANEIEAQRARSNAAIAAHDVAAMRRVFHPDYHVIPGSLGKPLPLADFDRRLGATFSDPTFVTYVRTPTSVTVGKNGKRAAETGTWLGTWRKPDGEMRLTGIYQATWVPSGKSWLLLNESFVSLACEGSAACGEVD